MTDFGLLLTLMTGLFAILAIAVGILTRIYIYPRIDTKLKRLYMNIPKIILGIFGFTWFLCFRYIDDVNQLINEGPGFGGIMYSKVLLLDLCPFAFVALSLAMIFDYNSKNTDIIALWAIIGSSITIFGAGWFEKLPTNMSVMDYLFKGIYPNKLYFFLHAWMLIFGCYFFSSANKLNFYRTLSCHISVVIYLIYVLIIINSLDVTRNATGLVEYDWMNKFGEYHAVQTFLKMNFPDIMWFSYFLVWLMMIMFVTIKNECHKPQLYSFWPKFAYNKFEWLKRTSEKYYNFKMKIFWKKEYKQKQNQDVA